MTKEGNSGFQRKQEPQDNWDVRMRQYLGLPVDASLEEVKKKVIVLMRIRQEQGLSLDASSEEVEKKATELLRIPRTAIAGAELVLGRRVDALDLEVEDIIAAPGYSGEEKLRLLLMQKSREDTQREQGENKG